MALMVLRPRRYLRDRHLRTRPIARDKDRPIVRRLVQQSIAQSRAPEPDGAGNIAHTPNDRSYLQYRPVARGNAVLVRHMRVDGITAPNYVVIRIGHNIAGDARPDNEKRASAVDRLTK